MTTPFGRDNGWLSYGHDGHPCRDCDQLYKDHPHSEGWR